MRFTYKAVLTFAVALGLLSGCSKQGGGADAPAAPAANEFRILAGSELKDVADKVTAFGKTQGIVVKFDYSGSLDAVDKLSESHSYDAVWLSHGKYLQMMPAVKSQIKASEKTMFSRVVLGVKPEKMKELGWKSGKTTWREIISASKAGKFRFGMTSPAGSNTGFVALVSVASELSGKGDALEEADIPTSKLKELFVGQSMTSGSSGVLADQFKASPDKADGLVNYESTIRSLNAAGVPLEVLIPKEGVITADYPLMLLTRSTQQAFYDRLVAYLRTDAVQQEIAKETFRTPLAGNGSDEVVNELPFPASVKVVDALLGGYLDTYSKPATSFFVLDVSGSMEGDRIRAMTNSMQTLAQGDGTVSGRFSTLRQREAIAKTTFCGTVNPTEWFTMTDDVAKNKEVLVQFSAGIRQLDQQLCDATAIYDALHEAYRQAVVEKKKGGRSVSIVLLSDGESNTGANLADFLAFVQQQGELKVPVYVILYGEINASEMEKVALATGGKTFDARRMSLKQVMKAIRSYQ